MTKDKALKQVLETLEVMNHEDSIFRGEFDDDIAAIKEALAQPEQEPVAWVTGWHGGHCVIRAVDPAAILQIGTALYTTPPQRKPLLASDIVTMYDENPRSDSEMIAFARAIEAAHGIKGEA